MSYDNSEHQKQKKITTKCSWGLNVVLMNGIKNAVVTNGTGDKEKNNQLNTNEFWSSNGIAWAERTQRWTTLVDNVVSPVLFVSTALRKPEMR